MSVTILVPVACDDHDVWISSFIDHEDGSMDVGSVHCEQCNTDFFPEPV